MTDDEPSRRPLGHQGGAGLGKKWGSAPQGDQEVQGGGRSHPPELLPLWTPLTLPDITSSAHVASAHGSVRKPSLRSLSDSLNVLSALLFLLGFTDEPITLNACFGEAFAFSLAKVQLAEFF